ncbi:hypothetical protein LUZ63_007055 [Rhynchospora breviuscula]|uniref:non-specific serine/threonine protein kinase n=1 Tax=Rhynchospora breviuscula TaxID=2022672 RepID=A0A9Q0CR00_9POAL|nr:hypothetical protein LUZ63_007055 [Rhynchospora breviuscula]
MKINNRSKARRSPLKNQSQSMHLRSKFARFLLWLVRCGSTSESRREEGSNSTRWVFSLKELHSATNSFNYDNQIGEGPFGSVYWGQLWDGTQIVVKRLKVLSNRSEADFAADVEVLGGVKHKNLLSFRGYCSEGQERLLVYDYMQNLSLYAHLHGTHAPERLLDWRRRMAIAIGSAQGIAYLHHHATPHIIHTDIKAKNILLDTNFEAHVADFGFSRLIPDSATHLTRAVKSAPGYLAPEYITLENATKACDVYSFGILLLELASGRRPVEAPSETKVSAIQEWAFFLAREKRFDEIADKNLGGKYSESELKRVVLVALVCSQQEAEKRPTMIEVIAILKGESKEMLSKLDLDQLYRPEQKTSSQGEFS